MIGDGYCHSVVKAFSDSHVVNCCVQLTLVCLQRTFLRGRSVILSLELHTGNIQLGILSEMRKN